MDTRAPGEDLFEIRLRWQALAESGQPTTLRVALLSTFTIDPLVPYLGTALWDAGLPPEILVAPFDEIVQQCRDPGSATAIFGPNIIICWPRLEDLWGGLPLPLADLGAEAKAGETGEAVGAYLAPALLCADACIELARQQGATLVFALPTLPEVRPLFAGDAGNRFGVGATSAAVREALRHHLRQQAGHALIFDADEVIREVGGERAYDPRLFCHGRIPFSSVLFARAGKALCRTLRCGLMPAKKVIVLDGDHTLWGGVIGEDGPLRVDLSDGGAGAAFRQFQGFLRELRRAGFLLALCSKNEAADVWAVFDRRDMVLRRDDLAAARIGWQDKAQALREIAAELSVGLDSLVFIDDNPAEIEAVKAELPQVACVRMPMDPAGWHAALWHSGALDRPAPTGEDQKRADFYGQAQERQRMEQAAPSRDDYLRELSIRAAVFRAGPGDLQRLAQLVNKTNQFNLNGKRRSEAELAELIADRRAMVLLCRASDRFGDYGVIGAAIVTKELADSGAARLDTFVLSCRALGRGIEDALLSCVFGGQGTPMPMAMEVQVQVEDLPRNEPARRFFAGLGCHEVGRAYVLRGHPWPAQVEREANQN